MIALYSRYNSTGKETCGTIEEAKSFLREMEDQGEGFAIGVIDTEKQIAYLKSQKVFGLSDADLREQKIETIKDAGFEINDYQTL